MPPEKGPPSSLPVYAAVALPAAVLLACLTSWLGPALLPLLLAAAGVALVGGLHYWLWGRGLAEAGPEEDSTD